MTAEFAVARVLLMGVVVMSMAMVVVRERSGRCGAAHAHMVDSIGHHGGKDSMIDRVGKRRLSNELGTQT